MYEQKNIIQVTNKNLLNSRFYGQAFVLINLFKGIQRYGRMNQSYLHIPSWKKLSKEVIHLEKRLTRSFGVSELKSVPERSAKKRADELEKLLTNNTIINYHGANLNLAREIKRRHGDSVKQFLTCHMTPEKVKNGGDYEKRCSKFIGPALDGYIAVSDFVRDELIKKGIPKEKVFRVYNGIDTELYFILDPIKKDKLKGKLGISPNEKVISYVGRIDHLKGEEILKNIIDNYSKLGDSTTFVIASSNLNGITRMLKYISKTNPKLVKRDKIHFYVDISKFTMDLSYELKKDVKFFFENFYMERGFYKNPIFKGMADFPIPQISDVGLFPTYKEALGLVPLEFIACGVPVIGSDVGGTKEILSKQSNNTIIHIPSIIRDFNPKDLDTLQYKKRLKVLNGVVGKYIESINTLSITKPSEDVLLGRKMIMDHGFSLDSMTSNVFSTYFKK
jgi:glycosyltransferase involved in cell wall biosynthesis